MKLQNIFKILCIMLLGTLFGCGGGGGGGGGGTPTPTPVAAKTTVSGTVSFPSITALVAKQLPKSVALSSLVTGTTVRAYTLDGTFAGEASGANLNLTTGAFTISNLTPGVDYVIKAVSGGQVLRKLIEKAVVAPNTDVTGQNLSEVSTAAVTVASQKLGTDAGLTNLVLGEPTTLTTTQKTNLSEKIFTDVSPQALEQQIADAKTTLQTAITNNDYSTITQQSLVDLVNTLNVVIAAISNNTDPSKLVTGTAAKIDLPTGETIKQFTLDTSGGANVVQGQLISSITPLIAQTTVTSSISSYVPPARVQLDISTDVPTGKLYGLTLDIIMPTGALNIDPSKLKLAAGVDDKVQIDASWDSTSRKMRVIIASAFPLPTGQLISYITDRTTGITLTAADFTVSIVKAVDENGVSLTSGFNLTKTVSSSGL